MGMTRRKTPAWRALCCLLLTTAAGAQPRTVDTTDANMLGFSADHAAQQLSLEQRFDALLDPNDQREWLKDMSSQPNHVGSPHDKANAEFMLAKFRAWGWDARIETFSVL